MGKSLKLSVTIPPELWADIRRLYPTAQQSALMRTGLQLLLRTTERVIADEAVEYAETLRAALER